MDCLEHKKLHWFEGWFTPREHRCKVLEATEYTKLSWQGTFDHTHTFADFQCTRCHEMKSKSVFQRAKSLKEMDFVVIKW